MGVSRILDPDGNLLWSPVSLEGAYTVEKTQSVAEIIESLMSNLTLNTTISIDDSKISNVYTKDEANALFVTMSMLNSTVESVVLSYVTNNVIPSESSLLDLRNKVLSLFKVCFGTDFDGNIVQANSYNIVVKDLGDRLTSSESNLFHIMSDLYETVGSEIHTNTKLFSVISDTGKTDDLSSSFSGDNKKSLAAAINYVQSQLSDISSQVGTVSTSLDTVSTNLGTLSTTVGTFSSINSSIKGNATSIVDVLNNISQQLTDLSSRVSALEG